MGRLLPTNSATEPKVYAHLRQTHSDAMIAQVSFEQAPAAKIVTKQAA